MLSIYIVPFISFTFIFSVTEPVDAGHTHSDLQPAAISILDGPSEDSRHIAYFQGDAFTWMQLKHAPANWQIVNLQTGWSKGEKERYMI